MEPALLPDTAPAAVGPLVPPFARPRQDAPGDCRPAAGVDGDFILGSARLGNQTPRLVRREVAGKHKHAPAGTEHPVQLLPGKPRRGPRHDDHVGEVRRKGQPVPRRHVQDRHARAVEVRTQELLARLGRRAFATDRVHDVEAAAHGQRGTERRRDLAHQRRRDVAHQQRVSLLRAGLADDLVGYCRCGGRDLDTPVGRIVDEPRADLGRGEAGQHALVGRGHEAAPGYGQAADGTGDVLRAVPCSRARGNVEGGQHALAADEQRIPGEGESIHAQMGCAPLEGLGGGLPRAQRGQVVGGGFTVTHRIQRVAGREHAVLALEIEHGRVRGDLVGHHAVVGQRRRLVNEGLTGTLELAHAVEVQAAAGCQPATAPLCVVPTAVGPAVQELPRVPVERGGATPARRHEQHVPRDRQIALRGHTREARSARVGELDVLHARGVVAPQHLAGRGVQGVGAHAFRGPHAGHRVDHLIDHHHPGPQRPPRDHAPVPQQQVVAGRCAKAPDHLAGAGGQAVHATVVRSHVDPVPGHGRREPNRAARREPPQEFPRVEVQRPHRVVGRRAEEHPSARDDRLRRIVEMQPGRFLARLFPRRTRDLRRLVDPRGLQRDRQGFL